MPTYRTFKRSCTDWKTFARARKITVDRRLTYAEARRQCDRFNDHRTPAQVRKGTKMEFEAE
jgi:hypothetical protein